MGGIFSFLFALLACVAMTIVLHGCGGDAPTPAPTPAPTAAPTPFPGCDTEKATDSQVLAEQLCDNGCVVQIKCGAAGECIRVPNDKCIIKPGQTVFSCAHHETCQEFKDESIEKGTCDKMTACCAFNSITIPKEGETKVVDPICNLAPVKTGQDFCRGAEQNTSCSSSNETLGEQLCDNGCVVEFKCDKDDKCARVAGDKCIYKGITDFCLKEDGSTKTCQEFRDEGSEKKECDKMTACCKFNSITIPKEGETKVTDSLCAVAHSKTDTGKPARICDKPAPVPAPVPMELV